MQQARCVYELRDYTTHRRPVRIQDKQNPSMEIDGEADTKSHPLT